MTASPLIPERGFRGPGCTDACEVVRAIVVGRYGRSELLLHDPLAHELYGRLTAGSQDGAIVHTGPLVIDRWQRAAFAYGVDLELTGREWELLEYLAIHAGRICPTAEILDAVWGPWRAENTMGSYASRLRLRMGPCAFLIETRWNQGYRLRLEPPIGDVMARIPRRPKERTRWTKHHSYCVCCGRTDRPHFGHGRCTHCRVHALPRRQHYGPCAAPPGEPT